MPCSKVFVRANFPWNNSTNRCCALPPSKRSSLILPPSTRSNFPGFPTKWLNSIPNLITHTEENPDELPSFTGIYTDTFSASFRGRKLPHAQFGDSDHCSRLGIHIAGFSRRQDRAGQRRAHP